MRYLFYILFIIILAWAGIWGYDQISHPAAAGEKALSVNDRVITVDELQKRLSRTPYAALDRQGFMEDLITRQILIQEAMKEGIHQEEAFRNAITDYFEQSLVKTLVDRKMASLRPQVAESRLDALQRLGALHYDLSLFRFATEEQAARGPLENPEQVAAPFLDLPLPLRNAVESLEKGSLSPALPGGGGYFRVRVDETRPLTEQEGPAPSRETLRQGMEKEQRQQIFDQWLSDLRAQARVELTEASEKAGEKK